MPTLLLWCHPCHLSSQKSACQIAAAWSCSLQLLPLSWPANDAWITKYRILNVLLLCSYDFLSNMVLLHVSSSSFLRNAIFLFYEPCNCEDDSGHDMDDHSGDDSAYCCPDLKSISCGVEMIMLPGISLTISHVHCALMIIARQQQREHAILTLYLQDADMLSPRTQKILTAYSKQSPSQSRQKCRPVWYCGTRMTWSIIVSAWTGWKKAPFSITVEIWQNLDSALSVCNSELKSMIIIRKTVLQQYSQRT